MTSSTTGGSTGTPVKYYHDAEFQRQEAAMILRNRQWTGWRYGEMVMRFWGSPLDLKAQTRLRSRLNLLLRNESMIDAYRMDASHLAGWPRRIQRLRPPLVEGYANVLEALVVACQQAGVALDNLGVKAVIATAEMLYPSQRRVLEAAFGCRVFNRYGSREVSTLAHECCFGRLHTIDDWVYVEIVDESGRPLPPGELGLVVVTSFYNTGMLLIRYVMDDLAAFSPDEGLSSLCPCGLPFRLLERLEGRVGELVRLPGGGYANTDLGLPK